MPVAVVTLVLAVVLGLYAPRRTALIVTIIAAVLTVAAFAWAVADGNGNDPWWLIAVGVACGATAIWACNAVSSRRSTRVSI